MSARSTSQARPGSASEPNNVQAKKQDAPCQQQPGGGGGRRRRPQHPGNPQHAPRHPQHAPRGGGRRGGAGRGPPPALSREHELGSLYQPGSKKQNLSHLLTNFQYGAPRGRGGGGGRARAPTHHYSAPKPRYSARHYLQAACQFIVRAGEDYTAHAADPDALVDWGRVEQVILRQSGAEPTACPICLFPPTAAKLTLCGHVYCWACVLHYLALTDDDSRKCPICEQPIAASDLRSVVVAPQEDRPTGAALEMRLMRRERDGLLAIPADSSRLEVAGTEPPTVLQAGPDRRFIKMFRASAAEVVANILQRERAELESQWTREGAQPEGCFIQQALALLAGREEDTLLAASGMELLGMEHLGLAADSAAEDNEIAEEKINKDDDDDNGNEEVKRDDENNDAAEEDVTNGGTRPRYSSGESVGSSEEGGEGAVTVADLDLSSLQAGARAGGQQGPRQTFYFYQASDGQAIFLHALNVQMLVEEFGSLEACPATIRAEILEKDSSSMTEELRDRLRYLRHLPLAQAFEVAELDISRLVSAATLALYSAQLEERARRRGRRDREERRREKRIEVEERRLMGRFPSPMARIESRFHYPAVGRPEPVQPAEDFPAMEGGHGEEEEGGDGGHGASFAKAAAQRPSASALPRSVSSPVTGWAAPGGRPRPGSDTEQEPEGYEPPPQPTSLGDALAAALAASGGGKGRKGRRGKGVTLLAGAPRPTL